MEDHICFDRDRCELRLLDQRLLPVEERTVVCRTLDDVVRALQLMVVRGAPAIGVTAGFGAVLALAEVLDGGAGDWRAAYAHALERLAAARPTAVNLRWGVERIRRLWQAAGDISGPDLLVRITEEALAMQAEDIAVCRAIGRAGAEVVGDGQTVLTHCNAGALATAGYGTALGVIRGACEAGKRVLIAAHGNSLRALVMQFEKLTPEQILEVNIPTGVPCSYTFDKDWNVIDKHYIGDPATIEAKINAVANQGKAKK